MSTGKRVLYVGGLDQSVTKQIVTATFIPFGDIVDVIIPTDENHISRGFGFVEFEQAEDAAAGLENMNLAELNGKTLHVNYAKPIQHQQMGVAYAPEDPSDAAAANLTQDAQEPVTKKQKV